MALFDKEEFANFNFDEFLSFRKFISPIIIKIVYMIGAVCTVFLGLYMMFNNIHSFQQFLLQFLIGILIIIFGNLTWRISCEIMLLLFSMNDELKKLNKK